ncbi:MAG: hypothetical protein ACRBFS_03255 [Aureispira sp.]
MTNFDPLDAPLKEAPSKKKEIPYVYTPKQMRLFKKGIWFTVVLNSLLYAVFAGINKVEEYFFPWLWLQMIIAILLGGVVGIYAFFKCRHLPYELRFKQWFTLYFLSIQCLVTILLIASFFM